MLGSKHGIAKEKGSWPLSNLDERGSTDLVIAVFPGTTHSAGFIARTPEGAFEGPSHQTWTAGELTRAQDLGAAIGCQNQGTCRVESFDGATEMAFAIHNGDELVPKRKAR